MSGLSDPDLGWRDDGRPFSRRFGDVYFSDGGARATRHVFIDGIDGPAAWRDRRVLSVAETGFGTGLNFLMLWDAWRRSAPADARLNYISVEGFPLGDADMARASAGHGGLATLSDALRAAMPPPIGGYHDVALDGGRVRLLLLYGPVADMLAGLVAQVDAWFLDGFAPARNPEMWTPTVFAQIARLSRPGARLASFTAAGVVRRGLAAAGFAVETRPGYEAKGECLAGRLMGRGRSDPTPWFAPPAPNGPEIGGGRVAVIGGGIAGCCMARALARRGVAVTIFEAGESPAAGASGTPTAIVQPRSFSGDDADGLFHRAAYRRAIALYDEMAAAGAPIWMHRGILLTGRDADDMARYRKLAENGVLGPGAAVWLEADAASARSGLPLGHGGVWVPGAGSLDTGRLCRTLASDLSIHRQTPVRRLEPDAEGWRLIGDDDAVLGQADSVVFAAGCAVHDLCGFDDLALVANRGQVTMLESNPAIAGQIAPLVYGGYLSPALSSADGRHVLGSSYMRLHDPVDPSWRAVRAADNIDNIGLLAARFPELAGNLPEAAQKSAAAWVGLRATTSDRFPVLGGVPDGASCRADYARLRHGGPAAAYPAARYRAGLYLFAGLGSRGFLTAPLAADILTAMITGDPVPQPRAVLDAMHPARFLIRDLKRRRGGAKMHETMED